MHIDVIAIILAGASIGAFVAVALGFAYFRDYTRDPRLRSGEMAWARAIRLSWVLLLLALCGLAGAVVNTILIPASKEWQHLFAIACVVGFVGGILMIATALVAAYKNARAGAGH